MQNRYAGDIGDFVKFAILRALAPGHTPGVAWWLYPDGHNGDGRHTTYLNQPDRWRHLDADLHDRLRAVVGAGARTVAALEAAGVLPGATFFGEMVPTGGPVSMRAGARQGWLQRAIDATQHCDLLFLDPDNGLEPNGFSLTKGKSGKSVGLAELRALRRPGRSLVAYHHQTRMAGGHLEELKYWGRRLRDVGFERVDALRAKPYSPRAFFLLDASPLLQERAQLLAAKWGDALSWHPGLGEGDAPQLPDPADLDLRSERPNTASKQELVRRFLRLNGTQAHIDSGDFVLSGWPRLGAIAGGATVAEVIAALKKAYLSRRAIWQEEYERHVDGEFEENELAAIVAFLGTPAGIHYVGDRWRMDAFVRTNTEAEIEDIFSDALRALNALKK